MLTIKYTSIKFAFLDIHFKKTMPPFGYISCILNSYSASVQLIRSSLSNSIDYITYAYLLRFSKYLLTTAPKLQHTELLLDLKTCLVYKVSFITAV